VLVERRFRLLLTTLHLHLRNEVLLRWYIWALGILLGMDACFNKVLQGGKDI
jgi:hypothetical protein